MKISLTKRQIQDVIYGLYEAIEAVRPLIQDKSVSDRREWKKQSNRWYIVMDRIVEESRNNGMEPIIPHPPVVTPMSIGELIEKTKE